MSSPQKHHGSTKITLCINDITARLELIPCIFYFACKRLIHAVHRLHIWFFIAQLILSKTDLEKAYCIMHVHSNITAPCVVTIG